MSKHGDLQVWWVPQVPMKSFKHAVATPAEARLLLDALAYYDLFQLENNIKPDFANAGGLSVFDAHDDHDGPDGSWVDWYDENGNSIDNYEVEQLREFTPKCDSITPVN